MLSIFHVPIGHLYIFFGKMSIQLFCPFFNWVGFFFYIELYELFIWRRRWHPTPVLLPGGSHGWRSLVGCNPWGCWKLDMTEQLHFHFSLSCIGEGNGNLLNERIYLQMILPTRGQYPKYINSSAKSLQSCPTLCDP